MENALSSFTKTDGPTLISSPGSGRGLPPRPNSARVKSTMKSLLSERSFKAKNGSQDSERTVLIVPDNLPSDCPVDKPSTSKPSTSKPSTSRSLSLNKILFSSSTKATHSLPVTPTANSGAEIVQGRHLGCDSDSSVWFFCSHYCFTVSKQLLLYHSLFIGEAFLQFFLYEIVFDASGMLHWWIFILYRKWK